MSLINLSISLKNDKDAIWVKGITDDSQVKVGVDSLYREALAKQATIALAAPTKSYASKKTHPYYLHKSGHGMKADLTAISKLVQTLTPTQLVNLNYISTKK